MKRILSVFLLLVAACSGETPDTRVPCTTQATCPGGTEFQSACENLYCTAKFPDGYLADLIMGVRNTQVRMQGVRSYRVFVVAATNPDGSTIKCPAAGGLLTDLRDPAKHNLTTSVTEKAFVLGTTNDTITSGVFLNGANRLVYAEVYKNDLNLASPGDEGPAIGTGCTEAIPYTGDPATQAKVILEIKPVSG